MFLGTYIYLQLNLRIGVPMLSQTIFDGASDRIRTDDLLFTKQVLYH